MTTITPQANTSSQSSTKEIDVSKVKNPYYSCRSRIANIIITFVVIFLSFFFAYMGYKVFRFSYLSMPITYFVTFLIALVSTLATLGGNGHRIYALSFISAFVSLIVAIVLFNTQIYLYTISIYTLGWSTTFGLINIFHVAMILAVVGTFVSSYLSLKNAVNIKLQRKWFEENQYIWKTSEDTNAVYPKNVVTPFSAVQGSRPYPIQQPYMLANHK